jgi:cation diffusion facilitator CzcD-associated flavoprotein CzcO
MARYLRKVAAQHGLYEHTAFDTELLMAEWLDDAQCWKVTTNRDTYRAQFLIVSTGSLEELKFPELAGRDRFEGRIFHAARWPENYTGKGDRIAVLGTSASGVQIVPEMQKVAERIYVFQRTPVHLLPLNREVYSGQDVERRRADAGALDVERAEKIAAFDDIYRATLFGGPSSDRGRQMAAVIDEYREAQVLDPVLRQKLTPDYALGCKRPTQSDLYYLSLQQPNVVLVDEGAVALGSHSISTESGKEYYVDTVVMATGYCWGGDILSRIRRRNGETVAEHQRGHRKAYKSVSLSGCPNLFLVGGAGANGGVWHGYAPGEIVPRYMFLVLDYMRRKGIRALEVKEPAELNWKRAADAILSKAPIVIGGCVNYCLDASGHDMANWPGNMEDMRRAMTEFQPADYQTVEGELAFALGRSCGCELSGA